MSQRLSENTSNDGAEGEITPSIRGAICVVHALLKSDAVVRFILELRVDVCPA